MSKDLRKALRHYIWHCPICKKETVHRPVHQELVACDVCDLVQHKSLKELLEASDSLSFKEVKDVAIARKELASGKCKTFKTADEMIVDLHENEYLAENHT